MTLVKKIAILIFIHSIFSSLTLRAQERIAILDFQVLGSSENLQRYDWMSQGFAETLSDAFSRVAKFSVIERSRLGMILGEQKLQTTQDFDTSTIVRAGKILGVNKLLLGSCQVITGHLLVNMRIVDVETGKIEPIERLPIIKPVDSVLFLQRDICFEILKQYNIQSMQSRDQVVYATSASTVSVSAYEMLVKGIRFFNNGQYDDALAMYNAALKFDMLYGKAFYRRGQTYFAMERYDNAIQDYKRAEKYLGEDSLYTLIGQAYLKQGNYKKSAEALEKANAINPSNEFIRRSLQQAGVSQTRMKLAQKQPDSVSYDHVYEFLHGIAMVEKKGKFGFIDTSDRIVIPVQLEAVKAFRFGRAAFKLDGKWGFIDDFGKIVIPAKYDKADDFDRNYLSMVAEKGGEGVINSDGKVILPSVFKQIGLWEWNKPKFLFAVKHNEEAKKELWGCYDMNGMQVLPHIYNEIKYLSQPMPGVYHFLANFEGKVGVIDNENRIILPFRYENFDCIRGYSNGYFATRISEKWGFVNLNGTIVVPHIYERVTDKGTGNYFQVKERGRWGLVDSGNHVQVPLIYDEMSSVKLGYWAVQKNEAWGVINDNNEIIIGFEYEHIEQSDALDLIPKSVLKDHKFYVRVQKAGIKYFINDKNQCIWDCPKK